MAKKWKGMGLLLVFVSLLLGGCGTSVQTGDQPDESEVIHSQSQSPPPLELKIGDDTFPAFRGGYSWSYYDPEEKLMAGVEAESRSPHEIANIEKGHQADKSAKVELIFGETPLSYLVFVWDAVGNQEPVSAKLDLSDHEGQNIFEIRAHWKQGDASYVFVLDVE
ncbi:hypothetical protein [Planococcus salinarum]|uniref:hypothetical protein n=1 Tax=Planococcus salinarum TaxID=622695 RepID=UPI000E3C0628|nr:hypothetical protein [Planococcus salinarum]TAA66224.1 hypothetical protein D2909_15560 [Planococcus salinarum]